MVDRLRYHTPSIRSNDCYGCYNLYLGLASFIPEYLAPGVPSGMTEDICLAYSWIGENTDATPMEVTFAVTPVNDAPEVLIGTQEGL